jgi:immune inhibitor A
LRGRPAPPDRIRIVFLLAQFPGLELTRPRADFTDPSGRTGLVERLVDYYAEVSAGRLILDPTVATDVVTLPQPQVQYVQRPDALLRDAFAAFLAGSDDPDVRAALEDAGAIIVFFAGPGKESDLRGQANDPWSNFTMIRPPVVTPAGRRIGKGCVIAAEEREGLSAFGVLCHEFGHLLGLPELYAPGGATHEGIGVWGLMGQGTWLGRGDRPPHLSAWAKVAMGWADVRLVTQGGRVTVPAADRSAHVVKLWARGPEHPQEYFLIENRQQRGTDRALRGSGLLIWRVDDRITGFRTAQSNPERMRVTLVQADGRDDLRVGHRAGGNRGDGGDPWRGMERWQRRLLDAAVLLGGLLLVVAGSRTWRSRRLDRVSALAAGIGLAGVVIGLGVSRSPSFGPATVPSSHAPGSASGRFTIS